MPSGRKIRYYLRAVPFHYLLRQALAGLARRILRLRPASGGAARSARDAGAASSPFQDLVLLPAPQLDHRLASYLSGQYCSHRFDLMGSGWLDSGYAAQAPGLRGHVYNMNLALPGHLRDGKWLELVVAGGAVVAGRALWARVLEIDPAYQPIDWQRDRKSGFRWSAREPHYRQFAACRGCPGADILQPWALSRLQHLPQMALIAVHQAPLRPGLLAEIQCQVLDFAATNPTGMGVNWSCTMDVAIRAANLVVTYWLLTSSGLHQQLHSGFAREFCALVYRHGAFVRGNLEYNGGNTGNHYLANLTGLLFVTAFLRKEGKVREWERHAVRELARETGRQFYPDGGHFEGASCYHALCVELLTYAAALASRSPGNPSAQGQLWQAVARGRTLLTRLCAPDGNLVQIGDNDSGRLFRLVPRGHFMTVGEARRGYEHLAGFAADDADAWFDENMLDMNGISNLCVPGTLEHQLLASLGGTKGILPEAMSRAEPVLNPRVHPALRHTAVRRFPSRGDLHAGLQTYSYPDSGLYLARADSLYLVLSAHTNAAQKLHLSHSHNDKLGLELYIDGEPVLTDPGSYLYTPLPRLRDEFRSVQAHNTLQVAGYEQNRFVDSFVSYPDAHCELLEISGDTIEVALRYRDVEQRRQVKIAAREVIVTDSCNKPFRQCWNDFPFESAGYGKLRRRR